MPAISVIIPMHNVEKYIGECLDSILAQTFQDFEVIVVDDCSTDNSAAIVKNYVPKFDGRLKLAKTLKNLGNPALPRNKGLFLSHGEYISFLDSDDAITPTALEELYYVAKNLDADVVACEKYYKVPEKFWNNDEFRKQLQPLIRHPIKFVDEPTFLTNNILDRLQLCNQRYFLWNAWSKLIRRDTILENELIFADTIVDDFIFTICLLCTAEKFVQVPNVVNYYRVLENSVSHNVYRDEKFFRKYVKAFSTAFRYFDKFLNDREQFRGNSYLKYIIFEICWSELLMGYFLPMYDQIAPHKFDKILYEELSDDDNVALSAFTFNMSAAYRLQLIKDQQHIAELEKINKENRAYISELENFVSNFLNKE